jgi:hypothetical protein
MRNERGLKNCIRIVASYELVNSGDVSWALCAGADFITSARGFMFLWVVSKLLNVTKILALPELRPKPSKGTSAW